VKPAQRRSLVDFLRVGFRVSERRACRVIGMHRTRYRYRSRAQDQTALRMRLRELASVRVRYGYRRLHVLLRREGWPVNAKRVYRLYRLEGLMVRSKMRKKRASALRPLLPTAQAPNEQWSMDFMSDSLASGQRFRVLTLVDTRSRESPAIEVDRSLTGERVVTVLERVGARCGLPRVLQVDNGPEFTSRALDAWAHRHGVKLAFSRPGTPTDNPFIEAFNGRLRAECLDQQWFVSLDEARPCLEEWRRDYNTQRPHSALGNQTPAAFIAAWRQQQTSEETG
jgi:putative transposase